jgi:hypothetical protein
MDLGVCLTMSGVSGNVRPEMADVDPGEIAGTQRKKHRHDLGHEEHGAKLAEGTTRGIQILLGLWIALTLCLVIYALVDASRPKNDMIPDAASTK